jgi:DNA-binding transcriptional ArsR family regulator
LWKQAATVETFGAVNSAVRPLASFGTNFRFVACHTGVLLVDSCNSPWYPLINQENLIEPNTLIDDWPEVYHLETTAQLRAVADELRQRILEELVDRAMTVTQLGELLGVAPARVHYHARELERVGLLKLVETREKGGILEKYYRTVARRLTVPPALFQRERPEDYVAALRTMLASIAEAFTSAMLRNATERDAPVLPRAMLTRTHLWLTDEQVSAMTSQLQAVIDRFQCDDPAPGARQYTTVLMAYETALATEHRGNSVESSRSKQPTTAVDTDFDFDDSSGGALRLTHRNRVWGVGAFTFQRVDLERAIHQGRRLDISVMGIATFSDDISADLADRAIGRFKHRGKVRATPELLAVLAQKEAAPSET